MSAESCKCGTKMIKETRQVEKYRMVNPKERLEGHPVSEPIKYYEEEIVWSCGACGNEVKLLVES